MPATITIGIPPDIHFGPLMLTWHGVMTTAGILAATMLAMRVVREKKLAIDPLTNTVLAATVAGIVGARFYFLVQTDAAALLRPSDWIARNGFAFYGSVLFGLPVAWLVLRKTAHPWCYLDAIAAGFPFGMAIGRVGDLIMGEHYGPPTTAPWGFAYSNPGAVVPQTGVAYQSGAFYEIVGALLIFAIIWPLRKRFRTPSMLLWTTLIGYGTIRFLLFFARRDVNVVALGLRQAQWTSLAVVLFASICVVVAHIRSTSSETGGPA